MANRRIQRKRGKQKLNTVLTQQERSRLIKETRELVNESNRRLRSIYNVYGRNRWASKRINILKGFVKSSVDTKGLIRVNKYMSDYELMTIKKTTKEFLSQKTSTLRGIKRTKKKREREYDMQFEDFDASKMDDEDYDLFEDFFVDNLYSDVSRYIDPSELQAIIKEARYSKWDSNRFMNVINTIVDTTNNDDLRDSFLRIYNKYVR